MKKQRISIRVNEDEKKKFADYANQKKMTISDYIRYACLIDLKFNTNTVEEAPTVSELNTNTVEEAPTVSELDLIDDDDEIIIDLNELDLINDEDELDFYTSVPVDSNSN